VSYHERGVGAPVQRCWWGGPVVERCLEAGREGGQGGAGREACGEGGSGGRGAAGVMDRPARS
jgi:hypothetical protein